MVFHFPWSLSRLIGRAVARSIVIALTFEEFLLLGSLVVSLLSYLAGLGTLGFLLSCASLSCSSLYWVHILQLVMPRLLDCCTRFL